MASLFRFSVRSLLVVVTIGCVGIAAMLNADALWESVAWGSALFLLSCAILLIVYRRDQQRAFWVGFVVFGGMYLAVLLYSFSAAWKGEAYASNPLHLNSLATTKLMVYAYERVIPDSRRGEYVSTPAGGTAVASSPTGTPFRRFTTDLSSQGFINVSGEAVHISQLRRPASSTMVPNPSYVQPGKFISIGHTLWLLVIAAIGGKVCQVIYRTRPQAPSP